MRFLSRALRLPRPLPPLIVDRRLTICVGAAVYVLILAVAPRLLNDPDTFWHVKLGKLMLASGDAPRSDVFSHTMNGASYASTEWLSEILMGAAHGLGGYPALAALTAVAVAAAFMILCDELARRLSEIATLAMLSVAFVLLAPHLVCRPHVLILPILALWATRLLRAAENAGSPPLALLPLMTLWANMHGSFLLGLGLVGAFSIEALCRASERRLFLIAKWTGFGFLALAATGVSPYGFGQLKAALHVFELNDALSLIQEWAPQNFSKPGPFELVLLALLGAALASGVVAPLPRVALLVLLVHMALAHVRHADLLALLGPILLAEPIARRLREIGEEAPAATRRLLAAKHLPHALLAGAIGSTVPAFQNPAIRPPEDIAPEAAVAAARTQGVQGRLFNDYAFGGYLISIGEPTFVDGRAELFGASRLAAAMRATDLREADDLARFLNENRVDWTLLKPDSPAARTLDRVPGWRRVHADENAVIHARSATARPDVRQDGAAHDSIAQ